MIINQNSTKTNASSTYRVNFLKKEFLQLMKISKPEFLFHVNRMFFYSFNGFVIFTLDCKEKDFEEYDI